MTPAGEKITRTRHEAHALSVSTGTFPPLRSIVTAQRREGTPAGTVSCIQLLKVARHRGCDMEMNRGRPV
jgi:hypothetical protein